MSQLGSRNPPPRPPPAAWRRRVTGQERTAAPTPWCGAAVLDLDVDHSTDRVWVCGPTIDLAQNGTPPRWTKDGKSAIWARAVVTSSVKVPAAAYPSIRLARAAANSIAIDRLPRDHRGGGAVGWRGIHQRRGRGSWAMGTPALTSAGGETRLHGWSMLRTGPRGRFAKVRRRRHWVGSQLPIFGSTTPTSRVDTRRCAATARHTSWLTMGLATGRSSTTVGSRPTRP